MVSVIENTLSLLDHGLIGRLRQDCREDWIKFIQHRFVKTLADGTLRQQEFQQFLIQDYLYLLDFCKVEALAVYKSHSLEEMEYFSSLLHGLLNIELPLHVSYCKKWGINFEQIQTCPKSLELLAYSQYLLTKSMQGDLLDLMILISPCLVGYGEIGLKMMMNPQKKNYKINSYQQWIDLYASEAYVDYMNKHICFLDKISQQYGVEQRYSILLEEFKMSVRLETAFWDVGLVTE